jgi:hypothetical protein
MDVLADADEPALRELVLPAPDAPELRAELEEPPLLVARRPGDLGCAGDGLPQRGQYQVVARKDQGEPDAVDPRRGAAQTADQTSRRSRNAASLVSGNEITKKKTSTAA